MMGRFISSAAISRNESMEPRKGSRTEVNGLNPNGVRIQDERREPRPARSGSKDPCGLVDQAPLKGSPMRGKGLRGRQLPLPLDGGLGASQERGARDS